METYKHINAWNIDSKMKNSAIGIWSHFDSIAVRNKISRSELNTKFPFFWKKEEKRERKSSCLYDFLWAESMGNYQISLKESKISWKDSVNSFMSPVSYFSECFILNRIQQSRSALRSLTSLSKTGASTVFFLARWDLNSNTMYIYLLILKFIYIRMCLHFLSY